MKKAILALVLSTAGALADDAHDLEKCLSQSSDDLRLKCYDAAVGYNPIGLEPNESVELASWSFGENQDAFTGADTSFVYLESEVFSRQGDHPPESINVRCKPEGGFEIFVHFEGYVGSRDERVRVKFKFDDGQIIEQTWYASTEGTSAFLPPMLSIFRKSIQEGKGLLFEAENFRGTPSRANFPATRMPDEYLNFVMNGCKS